MVVLKLQGTIELSRAIEASEYISSMDITCLDVDGV